MRTDPHSALQCVLVAGEVAKVYPDLVIRNASGRIDSVRHDKLAPMLLNEVEQQQRTLMAQETKNAIQDERNTPQAAEIRDLKQQVAELNPLNQATQIALRNLQAKDELVALSL